MASSRPFSVSFFEAQRDNHKRTLAFLTLGFVWVGTLGLWTTFVQLVLISFVLHVLAQPEPWFLTGETPLVWSEWGALTFLGLWLVVAAILYWRASTAFPKIIGARPISGLDRERIQPLLRGLLTASGSSALSTEVFIWEIPQPNAFACGRSLDHGSIVLTRGLVDLVENEELEGILGHELAHLKNHDTVYIVQAIAFVGMLVAVGYFGALLGVVIAAITGLVIALIVGITKAVVEGGEWVGCILAIFAVSMILFVLMTGLTVLLACIALFGGLALVVGLGMRSAASAISKSREYLADAMASQWTRNPRALARALAKVSQVSGSLPVRAALVQPLLFSEAKISLREGFSRWMGILMRTHPRIDYRIEALVAMDGRLGLEWKQERFSRWASFSHAVQWSAPLFLSATLIGASLWLFPWNEAQRMSWLSAGVNVSQAPTSAKNSTHGSIRGSGVRLRSGPGTDFPVVTSLNSGTDVAILQSPENPTSGWYHVRLESSGGSKEGWVAADLVVVSNVPR